LNSLGGFTVPAKPWGVVVEGVDEPDGIHRLLGPWLIQFYSFGDGSRLTTTFNDISYSLEKAMSNFVFCCSCFDFL